MNNLWIMAQAAGDVSSSGVTASPITEEQTTTTTAVVSDSNVPAAAAPVQKTPAYYQFIFIALMFVVMYFLLFRGPQKQKQQQQKMVGSLEKNDKVRTIGGIIGTVVDVKDDEITLKIDESNNTKIKIIPSAIGKNLSKEKN